MNSRPTRLTATGRAYLDLQKLAQRTTQNPQELFELYALEGFLARLSTTDHVSKLVLKRPGVEWLARNRANDVAPLASQATTT